MTYKNDLQEGLTRVNYDMKQERALQQCVFTAITASLMNSTHNSRLQNTQGDEWCESWA